MVLSSSGQTPSFTAAPKGKHRGKKQTGPSCLDGLCKILQHAAGLRTDQPQVLATAMQVLATMWQVGLAVLV